MIAKGTVYWLNSELQNKDMAYIAIAGESWHIFQKYFAHDDVIKWKHFPCYWSFMRRIHQSPVNSPHKGQWWGTFMFSLICALNKRVSKQSWGWWFETPSHSFWCHYNGNSDCNRQKCIALMKYLSMTERWIHFIWHSVILLPTEIGMHQY